MDFRKSILVNPEYIEKMQPFTEKGTKWMQKHKKPSIQKFTENAIDHYIKCRYKQQNNNNTAYLQQKNY